MDCYGIRYNRLPQCKTCEHTSYCKTAGYKSEPHNHVALLDEKDELPKVEIEKSELHRIADLLNEANHIIDSCGADLIFNTMQSMHWLHKSRPVAFKIALKKILNPEMSYTALSRECQLKSKQLVDYHLRQAVKVMPQLSEALLCYGYTNNRQRHGGKSKQLYNQLMTQPEFVFDGCGAI